MDEAIATLRRMYDAFNRRDVVTALACLHPEAEIRPLIGSVERQAFRGHDEVRRWMEEVVPETWAELEAHPEDYLTGGDALVVLVRNVGRGATSGVRAEQHVAHLVRMRDGLVAQLTSYTDRDEAFRTAGVSR